MNIPLAGSAAVVLALAALSPTMASAAHGTHHHHNAATSTGATASQAPGANSHVGSMRIPSDASHRRPAHPHKPCSSDATAGVAGSGSDSAREPACGLSG